MKSDTKNKVAKGDRLKWASLKDTTPVKLTLDLTKGKLLTAQELTKSKNQDSESRNFLIP